MHKAWVIPSSKVELVWSFDHAIRMKAAKVHKLGMLGRFRVRLYSKPIAFYIYKWLNIRMKSKGAMLYVKFGCKEAVQAYTYYVCGSILLSSQLVDEVQPSVIFRRNPDIAFFLILKLIMYGKFF